MRVVVVRSAVEDQDHFAVDVEICVIVKFRVCRDDAVTRKYYRRVFRTAVGRKPDRRDRVRGLNHDVFRIHLVKAQRKRVTHRSDLDTSDIREGLHEICFSILVRKTGLQVQICKHVSYIACCRGRSRFACPATLELVGCQIFDVFAEVFDPRIGLRNLRFLR